ETDPLLPPLAEDPDLAATEIQRGEVGGGELADPKTGRIGRFDEGSIAERDRDPERAWCRVVPDRLVHGREQALDLVDLEDARQATREPRRRDGAPRVARRETLAGDEPMERADRRETLRGGAAGVAHPEDREIGAEVAACRRSPVDAAIRQPVQVRPQRRLVRTLG